MNRPQTGAGREPSEIAQPAKSSDRLHNERECLFELTSSRGDLLCVEETLSTLPKSGGVFKAHSARLDSAVIIRLASRGDNEAIHLERTRLGRVFSTHIVKLLDHGEHEGQAFNVLAYLPGKNLREIIEQRGALPWCEAVNIVMQVLRGLDVAHRKGIVHCDIKPGNVILAENGHATIIDWEPLKDSANAKPKSASTSQLNEFAGTTDFIAPEQAANSKGAKPTSDLYSVGCFLFFLLTGREPFVEHETIFSKLQAHAVAPRPSCRDIDETIPRHLDRLVRRLMSVAVDERPRSAKATRLLLKASLGGVFPRFLESMREKAWQRFHRHKKNVAGTTLVAGVLFTGLYFLVNDTTEPNIEANTQPLEQQTDEFEANSGVGATEDSAPTSDPSQTNPLPAGNIDVPPEIREKYADLVDIILKSDKLSDQKKQEWIASLDTMTEDQRKELRQILE